MRATRRYDLRGIWPVAVVVLLAACGARAETPKASCSKPPPTAKLAESGETFEELASFDRMMRALVTDNEIPGAAIAVTRGRRLMYARGFGYADPQRKQPVKPDSLFRIASISKPITAVAVMRLVDCGKLKLDDRAFDVLLHEPHLPHGGAVDPRLKTITIRQLLQHTAGWDRGASFDPMFQSIRIARSLGVQPPAETQHIVRFMMGRQLDFDPGTRYAYSNFGYCVLGRVVEQAAGCSYEQYVRTQVLGPLGIRSMRIGKTLPGGRARREVCYFARGNHTGAAVVGDDFSAQVPRAYGAWYLQAMDSHGGWIASAVDLVRFASAVQDAGRSKLLSEKSVRAMFARPSGAAGHGENGQKKPVYYGCGWSVRQLSGDAKFNYWHTGGFDGTSTILVIRHDGLCWAVLFNTRDTPDGRSPVDKIDSLVHMAANAVERWPEHDLFAKFQ